MQERRNLERLSKSSPRQFWKKIKSQYRRNNVKAENLNVSQLYDHFKDLFSTENINTNATEENTPLQRLDSFY